MPTPEQYAAAFERERRNEYPVIDAFEKRMGFAVDRERLEAAARVLACPVKKNPPNWQHGRVIYALARNYLERLESIYSLSPRFRQNWLDIGTAKGFSALCMAWAMADAPCYGVISTYDVLDPTAVIDRNSVHGPGNIASFLKPFTGDDEGIHLAVGIGADILLNPVGIGAYNAAQLVNWPKSERINFAFIDGSHIYANVKSDISIVMPRQQPGDIIMFDDLQKPDVDRAVSELQGYDLEYITLLPERMYAIAVKQ